MTIEVTAIGKSTLVTSDIKESTSFYEDKLGLDRLEIPDEKVRFNLGDSQLFLLQQPPDLDVTSFAPLGEPDLAINTDSSIDHVVSELGRKGVTIHKGPVDSYIGGKDYQSVFIHDPDNHLIEIRTDNLIDLNRGDLNPEDHGFSQSL